MARFPASYYVNGILEGNTTVLSQAITLIESTKQSDFELAREIISKCLPHSGKSVRIGITGVPGVGKSTFIETFGQYILSQGNTKVAVLAIDPTSQETQGSILGDKTRMEQLATHKNAYIRPSAAGNKLGGVAQKTQETILLCEAAGYNIILIETVGVGQSETEVKNLTDFFLLLQIAGAGDELQGIKRGIMEMADLILINKAEKENLPLAKQAKLQYKNALHLFPPKKSGWITQVELCSAMENINIDKAWQIIQSYINKTQLNGFFQENRIAQNNQWFDNQVKERLLRDFYSNTHNLNKIKTLKQAINSQKITPFEAIMELFSGDV